MLMEVRNQKSVSDLETMKDDFSAVHKIKRLKYSFFYLFGRISMVMLTIDINNGNSDIPVFFIVIVAEFVI